MELVTEDRLLRETFEKDGAGKLAALHGETVFEDCRVNIREDSSEVAGPLMMKHG